MRIAIVHYHLRIGGVTRVIEQAVSALTDENIQVCVISGEAPLQDMGDARISVLNGLAYGVSESASQHLDNLVDTLIETARQLLGGEPDLWHIHNHSLGKNIALPCLVRELADRGYPLLLQMHDFAEDGRPSNYAYLVQELGGGDVDILSSFLYPLADHVHYAFLNKRDQAVFNAAGMSPEHLHYLPNAVAAVSSEPSESTDDLVLYPTRAIRRKNIGELLFWAALEKGGRRYAATRAPKNPAHQAIYNQWVEFAQVCALPVEFALAERGNKSFEQLMASASYIISTSVAEGFGLAFLEPWLYNCPLIGRTLDDITTEFTASGVDLSSMYSRLDIPVEWVGLKDLQARIGEAMNAYFKSYKRPVPEDGVQRALRGAVKVDHVDFGRLDEELQRRVIKLLADDNACHKDVRPDSVIPAKDMSTAISANKKAICSEYGADKYGARLRNIYTEVLNAGCGPVEGFPADRILDHFLVPERFSLLRT